MNSLNKLADNLKKHPDEIEQSIKLKHKNNFGLDY